MSLFKKRPSDFEWLSVVIPLLGSQKKSVDDFTGALSAEDGAKALLQLHSQTRQLRKRLNKLGTPTSTSAKEAHKSFLKALKSFEMGAKQGERYSLNLAGGLLDRSLAGGVTGRLSGSSLVFQHTMFYGLLEKAHTAFEATGILIDDLERQYMASTPPSEVIASIQFGKALVDGIHGLAELLDSGFQDWEPPYEPLGGDLEFDADEQREIDKAMDACQQEWAYHLDSLLPEYQDTAYQEWVVKPGVANGSLIAASIHCHQNRNFSGALSTWLKWFTHRSRASGWGLHPEAWLLLTEIYIGLRDIPKARQVLRIATLMVVQELEESVTYSEREHIVRSYQLPEWIAKLDKLCRNIVEIENRNFEIARFNQQRSIAAEFQTHE